VDLAVRTWLQLQRAVTLLLDSSKARKTDDVAAGIRQQLEKKEGLFRKNMMVRATRT
jgi:DNA-directed RNA polymerase I subunit RPA1